MSKTKTRAGTKPKPLLHKRGCVYYEGPSLFDEKPIAVILTGFDIPSANPKTGSMIQTWIIRQDIYPTEAMDAGEDRSVCGNCPLKKKICYVNPVTIGNVWKNYRTGRYPAFDYHAKPYIERFPLPLRLTAYGEAPFVPFEVWEPLLAITAGNTGYTHAWNWSKIDLRWRQYLQASVHTIEEALQAESQGWATFRPVLESEPLREADIACMNAVNPHVTCSVCQLCNGKDGKSVVDPIHGLKHKQKAFENFLEGLDKKRECLV